MWIELRTLNPPELVVSTLRLGQRAINVALRLHTSATGAHPPMTWMWNVAHLQHRTQYHSSSLSIQAPLEIMPIVLPIVFAYRFKNDRQTIGSAYRFT